MTGGIRASGTNEEVATAGKVSGLKLSGEAIFVFYPYLLTLAITLVPCHNACPDSK